MQRDAFAMSDRLGALVKIEPGERRRGGRHRHRLRAADRRRQASPPAWPRQLYQIAKLIAGNATVQGNRQIFFASSTASTPTATRSAAGAPATGNHADLLKELGDALGAFYAAMKALGLADAVTAFTQSDFGRTFTPNNSSGTDHAWGNHHLVLGGAVRRRRDLRQLPRAGAGRARRRGRRRAGSCRAAGSRPPRSTSTPPRCSAGSAPATRSSTRCCRTSRNFGSDAPARLPVEPPARADARRRRLQPVRAGAPACRTRSRRGGRPVQSGRLTEAAHGCIAAPPRSADAPLPPPPVRAALAGLQRRGAARLPRLRAAGWSASAGSASSCWRCCC